MPESALTRDFLTLADEALEAVRCFLAFACDPSSHLGWLEERDAALPPYLRHVRTELDQAKATVAEADRILELARSRRPPSTSYLAGVASHDHRIFYAKRDCRLAREELADAKRSFMPRRDEIQNFEAELTRTWSCRLRKELRPRARCFSEETRRHRRALLRAATSDLPEFPGVAQSCACEMLASISSRISDGDYHELLQVSTDDWNKLAGAVQREAARVESAEFSREVPLVDERRPDSEVSPKEAIEFTPVEKALVLLQKDGANPRSITAYANEAGCHRTTLSRHPFFQQVYEIAKQAARKPASAFPSGRRDPDRGIEGFADDLCANCREEPAVLILERDGSQDAVCERCGDRLR